MRQLTLVDVDQVEWQDVPEPVLSGPEAAVARPIAVSVCDFDRALVAGVLDVLPLPIPLGHEIVAEVSEIGASVRTVQVGGQVVVPLQVSCGACGPCRAGRSNSCEAVPRLSNYGLGAVGGGYGGGMSDLLAVPYADAMLVPVPEGCAPTDCVAVGCNLVDVHRCLAGPLAAFPGGDVLVVGGHGASFALYVVAMARVLGAGDVDFLADDPSQRAHAAALRARALEPGARLRRFGYSVVCDLSLDERRLAIGAAACAPDGYCIVPWVYPGNATPLPLEAMFRNSVTLVTGQPHARGHVEPVLDLIAWGAIRTTTVPTDVVDWSDAAVAYGRGTTKRIFVR